VVSEKRIKKKSKERRKGGEPSKKRGRAIEESTVRED